MKKSIIYSAAFATLSLVLFSCNNESQNVYSLYHSEGYTLRINKKTGETCFAAGGNWERISEPKGKK